MVLSHFLYMTGTSVDVVKWFAVCALVHTHHVCVCVYVEAGLCLLKGLFDGSC